jgi:N,N'-diacetyllegionaminate synthase
MTKTTIIAEVGSNYNGSLETAREYIRAAKAGGADAVKFQTIRKDRLVSPRIWSEGGIVDNPVWSLFASQELPDDWHFSLKETADREDIEFLSTPFYLEAVDLLERVGLRRFKIASGDLTFLPLLEAVGRTGKPVLLSTGASDIEEIRASVEALRRSGAGEVTLLHCVSNYPPRWDEMNLRAIVTLREAFGLPVGISDHSPGSLVPIASVALGASVIEKHVTFDRSLPGPDHPFAMTMEEFAEMVRQIRFLEEALGTGEKVPVEAEQAKRQRMRRGIYDPKTFEPTPSRKGLWLRPEHPLSRSRS